MKSGIYQIRNISNNKIYVGSASNLNKRWWNHRHLLRYNKHHSIILQRSWNKYKEESFIFEILEYVEDKKLLIQNEQKWIDTLKPAYNICKKSGSSLGWTHSEETKQKLRELNSGKNNPMFGVAPWNKGIRKEKVKKEKTVDIRAKIIIRISVSGEIKEYISISEASRDLGLKRPTAIQHALHGRTKTGKGFIWKFKTVS